MFLHHDRPKLYSAVPESHDRTVIAEVVKRRASEDPSSNVKLTHTSASSGFPAYDWRMIRASK